MKDSLLPLHRKFTEKEIIAQLKQQLRDLRIKNDVLSNQVNVLEKENFHMKEKIKKDDALYPDNWGGSPTVSSKAYRKAMERENYWKNRFWDEWAKNNQTT